MYIAVIPRMLEAIVDHLRPLIISMRLRHLLTRQFSTCLYPISMVSARWTCCQPYLADDETEKEKRWKEKEKQKCSWTLKNYDFAAAIKRRGDHPQLWNICDNGEKERYPKVSEIHQRGIALSRIWASNRKKGKLNQKLFSFLCSISLQSIPFETIARSSEGILENS